MDWARGGLSRIKRREDGAHINEARVTEKGCSLKSFLAATAVLTCLVNGGCHVAFLKGDSFTTGDCSGLGLVRLHMVSALRRARGNVRLNIICYRIIFHSVERLQKTTFRKSRGLHTQSGRGSKEKAVCTSRVETFYAKAADVWTSAKSGYQLRHDRRPIVLLLQCFNLHPPQLNPPLTEQDVWPLCIRDCGCFIISCQQ